jgi:intracellular sulfur oxidation DsrE/DsrF family protein
MSARRLQLFLLLVCLVAMPARGEEQANFVQTPYGIQKVVYDFYFDDPVKINAGLYWIRSLLNPLSEHPYNTTPDEHHIIVVIHGREIATVARKNYDKYKDAVERMRYYAEFGVEFKVCALAAEDFGYDISDFYEFIDVVPSAIPELAYWQQQGYSLITPTIKFKTRSNEEIR